MLLSKLSNSVAIIVVTVDNNLLSTKYFIFNLADYEFGAHFTLQSHTFSVTEKALCSLFLLLQLFPYLFLLHLISSPPLPPFI